MVCVRSVMVLFDTVVLFPMTLHLTCAFKVTILPNERVIALFRHFFLQLVHIAGIGQKAITPPQLQDPLSRAFHKY